MAKIIVLHSETGPRSFIEGRAKRHHQVLCAKKLSEALKGIVKFQPDLILAQISAKKMIALDLLRHIKRNGTRVPVVVIGEASAALFQPAAMKLGASSFVEFPMEQETLDRAISKALQKDKGEKPPVSAEELNSNISDLETTLNRKMQCFAGKNQVYIQSVILGGGRVSKPRIALKCPLRKKFGQTPDVYYEYIRDVCCGDPSACPAYQEFHRRHTA